MTSQVLIFLLDCPSPILLRSDLSPDPLRVPLKGQEGDVGGRLPFPWQLGVLCQLDTEVRTFCVPIRVRYLGDNSFGLEGVVVCPPVLVFGWVEVTTPSSPGGPSEAGLAVVLVSVTVFIRETGS